MKFEQLIESISQTADYFQREAVRQVNRNLTLRNWSLAFICLNMSKTEKTAPNMGNDYTKKLLFG